MKIFLTTKADKQLKRLPEKTHQFLITRIEQLAEEHFPIGIKKLQSRDGWRLRVGDYRILYTINFKKKEIIILSVAHQKEIYRL